MLILSRKPGEKIVINDTITVVVYGVRGDKVRLGIEAPADMPIHRGEVWNKIQKENDRGEA